VTVKIDLPRQTLTTPAGREVEFPVDAFSKHCLVEGVDELGYILGHEKAIAAYEAQRVGSVDTRA
jgi:3-isopropylmalate/(R)-2-methylmalate dehydratase small subunit